MKPFLRMLHEAANDKSVIGIKMTLYRLSRQSQGDRGTDRGC